MQQIANRMKFFTITILTLLVLLSCATTHQFHKSFSENFSKPQSKFFHYGSTGKQADFSWKLGKPSGSEAGTDILSFRINPEQEAGAGKGPEIISNRFTHFGTYSTRLKVPDPRAVQPDVGAVVGYFTYHMDTMHGLSEIDFEWLLADPAIIYVGTWTGPRGNLKRIGRILNIATGSIISTSYREQGTEIRKDLTGEQSKPEKIPAIPGFDASSQFHTYGFDWCSDQIRWWMIHPETADTIDLWHYRGSEIGIPQTPSYYRMNFWHTDNWAVEGNPNSLERPKQPYELEVDWMSYDPFQ